MGDLYFVGNHRNWSTISGTALIVFRFTREICKSKYPTKLLQYLTEICFRYLTGYGIDGDLRMLILSVPILEETLQHVEKVVDLQLVHQQVQILLFFSSS